VAPDRLEVEEDQLPLPARALEDVVGPAFPADRRRRVVRDRGEAEDREDDEDETERGGHARHTRSLIRPDQARLRSGERR